MERIEEFLAFSESTRRSFLKILSAILASSASSHAFGRDDDDDSSNWNVSIPDSLPNSTSAVQADGLNANACSALPALDASQLTSYVDPLNRALSLTLGLPTPFDVTPPSSEIGVGPTAEPPLLPVFDQHIGDALGLVVAAGGPQWVGVPGDFFTAAMDEKTKLDAAISLAEGLVQSTLADAARNAIVAETLAAGGMGAKVWGGAFGAAVYLAVPALEHFVQSVAAEGPVILEEATRQLQLMSDFGPEPGPAWQSYRTDL